MAAPAPAQQPEAASALDRYVGALASDGQFSGTVLVARGDEVVFEKSYGRRDVRATTPNEPATLFAVASVTKPLTGIIVRSLAQRGALSLDDPISRWLPDFPNGSRITIQLLLEHRAGIRHRVTQPTDELQSQTGESMAQIIARAPLVSEPGGQRLYSSAGYSLLAHVLERATGKRYATLLHEIVLDPSGANAARDATETAGNEGRAAGHFWTPDGPMNAPDKQLSFLVGAGSLWATPRQLFGVVRRIATDGFSAPSVAGARAANGAIQWAGFSNGSQAVVDYNPATSVTVIVTSNLLTGAIDGIVRDAPSILAGRAVADAPPRKPVPVALSTALRSQLAGTYNFAGNEHQLVFSSPSVALLGGEYVLIATGDSTFYAPQNYADFVVARDSSGAIESLHLAGNPGFAMRRIRSGETNK